MTIIDTATVSALLLMVSFAILAALVATGIAVGRMYAAQRPAPVNHRVSAAGALHARIAH
jgi:hypothetical protein